MRWRNTVSLQENEENGGHEAAECSDMIPLYMFTLEDEKDDDGENSQRNDFLYHLELQKVERASVNLRAYPVRWDHKEIFEQSDTPGGDYDKYERPGRGNIHFLKFQVSVPGECHKDI